MCLLLIGLSFVAMQRCQDRWLRLARRECHDVRKRMFLSSQNLLKRRRRRHSHQSLIIHWTSCLVAKVLWDDDLVETVAEGKQPVTPIKWDKILMPIDENIIKQDDKVRMCADTMEKDVCPKYGKLNPFKVFDYATWTLGGEDVKHYNVFCQGTESSPCSHCSEDSQTKNPPCKKAKQAKPTVN